METANSCVQGAYCPPIKPVKSVGLTVSKTVGNSIVRTNAWINEGSSAEAFELKIQNDWIDSGLKTAAFVVTKKENPPESIKVNLGTEFKLQKQQLALVQKNNETVLKLTLQRIDQLIGCSMEGPCFNNTYAVFTASHPTLGMLDFKVKLKESEKLGNFTVYFSEAAGDSSSGKFVVKELESPPEGIYVNLGIPFTLLENQTAKVKETGLKVKITGFAESACQVTAGTSCPSNPEVSLEVYSPNGYESTTIYLKAGGKKEVFEHVIKAESISSGKSAELLIVKSENPPTTKTVYLNEKFELLIGETANVMGRRLECPTDGSPCNMGGASFLVMKLKVLEIGNYKCEETTASSTAEVKCMGGRFARVELTAPANAPQQLETSTVVTLRESQSTLFNGFELRLLDILTQESYPVKNKAVFIVQKPTNPPDYRQVELNQKFDMQEKEKVLIAGEDVIVRLNGIYQGATLDVPVSKSPGVHSAPAFEIRSQPSHRVWLKFEKGKGKILSANFAPESSNCFDIHIETYGEPVCKEGTEFAQGTECRYYLQRNTWGDEGKKCVLQITYEDGSTVRTRNFESTGTMHMENIYEVLEIPKESYVNVSVWKQPSIYSSEKELESAKEFNYNLKVDESLSLYGLKISLLGINGGSTATFIATKENENPKIINVHINEPFKLSPNSASFAKAAQVLEANLRIDALSINSEPQVCPQCSQPTDSNVAPNCGYCPPAKYTITFSVNNYLWGVEEIAKEVSPSAIQKTAVSSMGLITGNVAAIGSTGDEVAIPIPSKPWKQYTLSAGESVNIGEFEIQVSDVSWERAEFKVVKKATGLKVHYVIKEGFNLFSLPGSIESISSNCESSSFKIFQYAPGKLPPWDIITSPQNGIAYWLLNSGKSCESTGIVREATPLASLPSLVKGWNFTAIVPEMIGSKINELGTCKENITKAFYYNASSKKWEKVLNKNISESDLGKAFAVYSLNACSLGEIETPELPPMPTG
jgi:hypothetical protein